jgi:hypothetical protein
MGGLWWVVRADSIAAIRAAAPILTVFDEPPDWFDENQWALVLASGEQDIASPSDPALREVLNEQS